VSDTPWAVICNWNGGEINLACVRSLVAQGIDEHRIVFVDNASTDGSPEAVALSFPRARLLRNEHNLGYGAATNQGIELALEEGAELVLLVNNDVTFAAGALAGMMAALHERDEPGIVGPRIVYASAPETIWSAGGRLTFRQNLSTMIGHGRADGPRYQRTLDVDYVAGCAMLVRSEVFRRVGRLDDAYFAYHEDLEFCLQAKQAGFGVRMVGATLAYHDAHRTTGGGYNARRKYMMGVNTVWFLRRHGTPLRWLSFFVFDVLSLPFAWAWRTRRGEGAAVLAKARGTLDGLRGRRVTAEVLGTAAAVRHERAA